MSKNEEIQNRMMDYLFNEMDPAQRKEFEKILESRPDLQSELNELKQMSNLLTSTPSVVPEFRPHFLTISKEVDEQSLPGQGSKDQAQQESGFEDHVQQRRGLKGQNQSYRGNEENKKVIKLFNPAIKAILAIAATLIFILFGSSLAGMEMGQTEEGFYLTFGSPPTQSESGISEEQVLELIEQFQAEQTLILTSFMEEAQQQQNDKLNEMIFVLADYYEDRRQEDLMMFVDGLEQLETQTHYRFNRTNEALGDLIYAISNPQ